MGASSSSSTITYWVNMHSTASVLYLQYPYMQVLVRGQMNCLALHVHDGNLDLKTQQCTAFLYVSSSGNLQVLGLQERHSTEAVRTKASSSARPVSPTINPKSFIQGQSQTSIPNSHLPSYLINPRKDCMTAVLPLHTLFLPHAARYPAQHMNVESWGMPCLCPLGQ